MNSKSIIAALVVTLFAASCSGAKDSIDQSNLVENKPKPEVKKSIPEHQKVGYMRIFGDLQWDQLTSPEEWQKRFPGCFGATGILRIMNRGKEKCILRVADVDLSISRVFFSDNSGTKSGSMTSELELEFEDRSQERAFKLGLIQKYGQSLHPEYEGYRRSCSRYACWDAPQSWWIEGKHGLTIKPTRYAIRLLDNFEIDTSDL